MRKYAQILAAGAAIVLAVAPAAAMIPIASDPVATTGGAVAGTALDSGVRAYLGIPFAKAPVGNLRWSPPQAARWAGVFNADRRGAECIQVLRPHDINHYFGEEPTSEDCLFLNVWTPSSATAGAKLPVIVFIHGGGYTVGSSGMANYDGEAVAKAGAIFVNFNYRLGAFGFLAHPDLSSEQGGHSGNYGLLDQIAALRWIRENIGMFGGDPDKVLITGQSAGAGSVAAHIFSPMSRGLFRAAMMSSGCNFTSESMPLADAEKVGVALQQRLHTADLRALRQVPADRILAIQSETQLGVRVDGVRIPGPIMDGYVLPAPKAELLKAGRFNAVPIIASYNGDDIDIGQHPIAKATNLADYRSIADKLYGPSAREFLALYPARTDADVPAVAHRAAQDAGLELRARQCAALNLSQGHAPTYIDQFVRKHPYVPGVQISDQNIATIGAYHTADIPYWLGTLDKYNSLRATRNWTPWDRYLSARMMGSLIALASTGSPSTPAMAWPAWRPGAENKLVLGDRVAVGPLDLKRLQWNATHPFTPAALTPTRIRD